MRKGIIEFRGNGPIISIEPNVYKQIIFTHPFVGLLSLAKILFKAYKNKNHTMFIIHWDK